MPQHYRYKLRMRLPQLHTSAAPLRRYHFDCTHTAERNGRNDGTVAHFSLFSSLAVVTDVPVSFHNEKLVGKHLLLAVYGGIQTRAITFRGAQ